MQNLVNAIVQAVDQALTSNTHQHGEIILEYMAVTGCTEQEAINKFSEVFLAELSNLELPFTATITATEVNQ
ncbi:hypothetical protein RBI94_02215 [Pseudomonas putida]|uniref:hypothetical protein n=1 Tax=Pseudomonas putida TaxID=303 RepID=UPI0007717210|nr:hypothetical protein [Pseudomonas putida]KWW13555.1 hypothetical protein AS889_18040 [Pseudomonas putida]MDQ2482836.1 hypothetical protein [Pseudomonas putida]